MLYNKEDFDKPLDECSKEENSDGVSEHDTMLAISRMPDEFTHEQLQQEVAKIIVNRALRTLSDKGLINMIWDEKDEEFKFYAEQ